MTCLIRLLSQFDATQDQSFALAKPKPQPKSTGPNAVPTPASGGSATVLQDDSKRGATANKKARRHSSVESANSKPTAVALAESSGGEAKSTPTTDFDFLDYLARSDDAVALKLTALHMQSQQQRPTAARSVSLPLQTPTPILAAPPQQPGPFRPQLSIDVPPSIQPPIAAVTTTITLLSTPPVGPTQTVKWDRSLSVPLSLPPPPPYITPRHSPLAESAEKWNPFAIPEVVSAQTTTAAVAISDDSRRPPQPQPSPTASSGGGDSKHFEWLFATAHHQQQPIRRPLEPIPSVPALSLAPKLEFVPIRTGTTGLLTPTPLSVANPNMPVPLPAPIAPAPNKPAPIIASPIPAIPIAPTPIKPVAPITSAPITTAPVAPKPVSAVIRGPPAVPTLIPTTDQVKAMRAGAKVRAEIISSEDAYVKSLRVVCNEFVAPFLTDQELAKKAKASLDRAASTAPAPASADSKSARSSGSGSGTGGGAFQDLYVVFAPAPAPPYLQCSAVELFGPIESLYQLHSEFLVELKASRSETLSPVFTKFLPFFKLYTCYVTGYESRLHLIQSLTRSDRSWRVWIEQKREKLGLDLMVRTCSVSLLIRIVSAYSRARVCCPLYSELFDYANSTHSAIYFAAERNGASHSFNAQ